MPQLVALSFSIAVLGGIWAYLALGPLSGIVLVWAGFIAWGCFFHAGGDNKALVKTIAGTTYGVLIGWIALLILFKAGVADMGAAAIASVVGVTVFFLVIVASIEPCRRFPLTFTATPQPLPTRCTRPPHRALHPMHQGRVRFRT